MSPLTTLPRPGDQRINHLSCRSGIQTRQQVKDPSIEFEYLSEITLDQFKTATGTKLVTFKFAGEIYRQNTIHELHMLSVGRTLTATISEKNSWTR